MPQPAHKPSEPSLGDRLKQLRVNYDLTLREIERRSDGRLRSSHLSQIETGKVHEPSLSFLRELARVFDLPFADLLAALDIIDDDNPSSPRRDAELMLYLSNLSPKGKAEALRFLKFLSAEGR